jgi:hypothetical protein
MRRTVSFLALGTALAVATIHGLAIAGFAPWGMAPVFPALFVAFGCFAALLGDQRERKIIYPLGLFANWPAWAFLLFGVVFLCAGVNFVWFFASTGGGALLEQSGQTFLADHGRIIRPLDAAGVRAFHAWEVRLFSGHILPFVVLPGLYFLVQSRQPRAPDRPSLRDRELRRERGTRRSNVRDSAR